MSKSIFITSAITISLNNLPKRWMYMVSLLMVTAVLPSCEGTRPFELDPSASMILNGTVQDWLSKMPFEGKMNTEGNGSGDFVLTNAEQVFPHLGKFYNENGPLIKGDPKRKHLYIKKTNLYKDPTWGECFAHAGLLYEAEEIWLRDYYSEMGNVAFSGANAINESYAASLEETLVYEASDGVKSGLYWTNASHQLLLSGFYQRGQLVFQFGFPCSKENAEEGLQKACEISRKMGLHRAIWDTATVDQLKATATKAHFWEDPYLTLFRDGFLPAVKMNLAREPLEEMNAASTAYPYEKVFEGKGNLQGCVLGFNLEKEGRTKEAFNEAFGQNKTLETSIDQKTVYLLSAEKKGQFTLQKATVHFLDTHELTVYFEHPENMPQALMKWKTWLTSLKLKSF